MPVSVGALKEFVDRTDHDPTTARLVFMFRQAAGVRQQAQVAIENARKALEQAEVRAHEAMGYEKGLQDVLVTLLEAQSIKLQDTAPPGDAK